jgi:hypothetical protein
MRILVKNEANAAHNGIYVRSSSTVLTRATDFDTPAEMAGGDFTFVNGGSLYDNTGWVMTDPVTTVGTSDVNWTQFSGAGTYTAGTGLTLTGSQFSVNASQTQITSVGTLGSLTVTGTATAGNLSTGGTLSVTGNANVGNIGAAAGVFTSVSGNGSALTALNASNISTGTLAQARLANASLTLGSTSLTLGGTTTTVAGLSSVTSTTFVGALTGAATTAGTVTTAAQPNITSVGTLSSLTIAANGDISMSGTGSNINGVYLVTANFFAGDGSNLSSIAGGNVTGTVANATYAVSAGSAGSATTAGTVTTAAQPNITSVGTLSSLTIAANGDINMSGTGSNINGVALVSATLFEGSGANLTNLNASNISSGTLAQARLANSSLTVNGTAISLGGSGTITASTTNTLTIGSYLTGGSFNGGSAVTIAVDGTDAATASKVVARDANASFAGNVITATTFSGSGSGISSLNGSNITTGTVAAARVATLNQNTTGYAATVSSAAQPNITSVGTLTSLSVTGNVSGGNLTTTGTVGSATATLLGDLLTTGANTTAGTITGNWTLSAGSKWNATYADLAEKYVADADYEPGTVLVFGGEHEVTLANEFDSTKVAGVVTTDPAFSMNSACEGEHVAEIALQGRVPCKVHGPVAKGDLMVSGQNGHAVANNMARAGTIIGKALQNFEGGSGVIEVAVGRF